MKPNLEEKRKEIFDLHQSWLRPDVPLMRQAPPPAPAKDPTPNAEPVPVTKRNNTIVTIVFVTAFLVLLELLFFAHQLGWFK